MKEDSSTIFVGKRFIYVAQKHPRPSHPPPIKQYRKQRPLKRYFTNSIMGTIDPNGTHYYYGQNRFHARFPWEDRNLEVEIAKIKEAADEHRPTFRERLSRESGYTGLSILCCGDHGVHCR